MSEGRYNIPKQYKVDRGMPVELLNQRIENQKCRQIFDTEISSMTWCYQITDDGGSSDATTLMRAQGISVFEVVTRHKVSSELMTEVFAGLIPKRMLIMYICDGELATAIYIPKQQGKAARVCATDFYPYDTERMIDVLDFEHDFDKTTEQLQLRLLATVRQQKKIIMIEKAFESMKKEVHEQTQDLNFEFSEQNLDRIREEADYVQEQLRVKTR